MTEVILRAKVFVKNTVSVGDKILYGNIAAKVTDIKDTIVELEVEGKKLWIESPKFFNVIDEIIGISLNTTSKS